MTPSDINITPVRGADKNSINVRAACEALLHGGHIPSDPYELNGAITRAVTGRCLKFDMDCEEDRNKYADLVSVATSTSGDQIQVVWEERVNTPSGGLIVYICFIELGKVASKFIGD